MFTIPRTTLDCADCFDIELLSLNRNVPTVKPSSLSTLGFYDSSLSPPFQKSQKSGAASEPGIEVVSSMSMSTPSLKYTRITEAGLPFSTSVTRKIRLAKSDLVDIFWFGLAQITRDSVCSPHSPTSLSHNRCSPLRTRHAAAHVLAFAVLRCEYACAMSPRCSSL